MERSNGPGHYGNSDTKVRRLFLLALENVKKGKGEIEYCDYYYCLLRTHSDS